MADEKRVVTHVHFADEFWKDYYMDVYKNAGEALEQLRQHIDCDEARRDFGRVFHLVKTFGLWLHQPESQVIVQEEKTEVESDGRSDG